MNPAQGQGHAAGAVTVSHDRLWLYLLFALLATAGFFYINIMSTIVDGLITALGFANAEAGLEAGRPHKLTPTPKGQGIFAPDRRRAGASVAGIIQQLPRAARTVPATLGPLQRQFLGSAELGDIGTSSLRRLDLKRRFIAGQADAMKAARTLSATPPSTVAFMPGASTTPTG